MKQKWIAVTLMFAGATMMLHATDIQKNEVGAEKLASYLRGASYYDVEYSVITDKISDIVKTEDIPKDVYVATVEKVADELLADTFVHTNSSGKAEIWFRRGLAPLALVSIIGLLDEPGFLPWLEQLSTETHLSDVREYSAEAYVRISGLGAVPFVRKILSESREKYDLNCKYLVIKELFNQIAMAETAKALQEKIDIAYEMLIEHAQHATHVSEVTPIDKMLCQQVPFYKSSIQRESILSRFVNSTNETVRGNYNRKFNELQKTPKAERIDLRTRFPGLAETKTDEEKISDAPDSADDE